MAKRSDSKFPAGKPKVGTLRTSGYKQAIDLRQIALLQAIDSYGSTTAAAKQLGISYKTAWDRLQALNNLSAQPLVHSAAGGNGGGGTRLTAFGQKALEKLKILQQEQTDFFSRLGENTDSPNSLLQFLHTTSLLTSARNQYWGQVQRVISGTINTELELSLADSLSIVATITKDSFTRMELEVGSEVIALIKSSWVMLSNDTSVVTSARNQLSGEISHLACDEVDTEVSLDLGNGKSLSAVITNASCKAMKLAVGQRVSALFKATSVILMQPRFSVTESLT
ncbi:MAG: TOBE domain-containing protein [Gammaproteobacteria bacterium]|nr:TOBE domain-containing protein [Gammaproteobacteria bacterium]